MFQPCRCLCRGSTAQITRTAPLRRTILQLRQTFLTDARTFMFDLTQYLLPASIFESRFAMGREAPANPAGPDYPDHPQFRRRP
jgi:hypothetical protein